MRQLECDTLCVFVCAAYGANELPNVGPVSLTPKAAAHLWQSVDALLIVGVALYCFLQLLLEQSMLLLKLVGAAALVLQVLLQELVAPTQALEFLSLLGQRPVNLLANILLKLLVCFQKEELQGTMKVQEISKTLDLQG